MLPSPEDARPPQLRRQMSSADLAREATRPAEVEISRASRELRALAALSGSLTDALGPQEAADLVEQQALSALGATSAVVVTLGAYPRPAINVLGSLTPSADTTLHVVHAIGLPAELRAALDELRIDAPVPFADVARTGSSRR